METKDIILTLRTEAGLSQEALLDYLVAHMPNPDNAPDEVRRGQFDAYLSQLAHWK